MIVSIRSAEGVDLYSEVSAQIVPEIAAEVAIEV